MGVAKAFEGRSRRTSQGSKGLAVLRIEALGKSLAYRVRCSFMRQLGCLFELDQRTPGPARLFSCVVVLAAVLVSLMVGFLEWIAPHLSKTRPSRLL